MYLQEALDLGVVEFRVLFRAGGIRTPNLRLGVLYISHHMRLQYHRQAEVPHVRHFDFDLHLSVQPNQLAQSPAQPTAGFMLSDHAERLSQRSQDKALFRKK
jgi:hypothetical protein